MMVKTAEAEAGVGNGKPPEMDTPLKPTLAVSLASLSVSAAMGMEKVLAPV